VEKVEKIIILDTETTGLDPIQGHRIIEIGCIEVLGRKKTGNIFHRYVNPERHVPDEAFRIHGLSTEFLKDKPKFAEIADEFADFIAGSTLVIHNAGFDMKFIHHEMKQYGILDLKIIDIIDTLPLARRKFPGSPANLDALCKRFNIDSSARTHHGALLDSELLFEVYLSLTGGAQSSLELDRNNHYIKSATKQYRPPREFKAKDDEIARHKEFIAKMKNSLWDKIDS
jgi:DNA polymerase III subunit epsilon